ncbi:MAG: helix-turn-helix transcriptional regulator [Oscillospiraceae bacterium]|nr:helix-turn-helix transcriptional regulator [Oscillospiraceae bacterium]
MSSESMALTEAAYYILLSLHAPLHGYGIMLRAAEMSGGRVRLAAGTLYGALSTLLDKGWITALPEEAGSRKKAYIITAAGREVARAEWRRLSDMVAQGASILEEDP